MMIVNIQTCVYFIFLISSRLGCQITVTEAFDGITLTIPESRDVRED